MCKTIAANNDIKHTIAPIYQGKAIIPVESKTAVVIAELKESIRKGKDKHIPIIT